MITKKLFPSKEGWIIATLSMCGAAVVDADQIKRGVSINKPDDYEWSDVEQHGKTVRVAFRRKKSEVPL